MKYTVKMWFGKENPAMVILAEKDHPRKVEDALESFKENGGYNIVNNLDNVMFEVEAMGTHDGISEKVDNFSGVIRAIRKIAMRKIGKPLSVLEREYKDAIREYYETNMAYGDNLDSYFAEEAMKDAEYTFHLVAGTLK